MLLRMVRSLLAIALAIALDAAAHPSVSVLIAPDGDVYYSDLEKVWRVGRDGQKRVAVPNVHAHELWMDASGAIYGEDSKWLGGDRYRHRIWKRAEDGTITDVVPWRDGFWRDYGFTRDASGAMYWVKCTPARVCSIRSSRSAGNVNRERFNTPVNWILASPSGDVYVVDGPNLRRVNRRGEIQTIARVGETLMGMTLDRSGNVYVAAYADRAIVRVTPSGKTSVVARSTAPWAPTGVGISSTGAMWVLEWDVYKTRVRRIDSR